MSLKVNFLFQSFLVITVYEVYTMVVCNYSALTPCDKGYTAEIYGVYTLVVHITSPSHLRQRRYSGNMQHVLWWYIITSPSHLRQRRYSGNMQHVLWWYIITSPSHLRQRRYSGNMQHVLWWFVIFLIRYGTYSTEEI